MSLSAEVRASDVPALCVGLFRLPALCAGLFRLGLLAALPCH